MKKLFFTLLLGITVFAQSIAQDVNQAIRYIKVANTLREVKQFDQSEEYLQKALNIVRSRDAYWEAAVYENYGFLFRDQENNMEASRNFMKALEIYKKLKMSLSEKAVAQLMEGIKDTEEQYAGIDIGAKGVKLSIIGVSVSPKKGLTYNLRKALSINTEPSALSTQAIKETANAVRDLIDSATVRLGIPADRMFIVMSSGLKQALDKQTGKEAELIGAIKDGLKNPAQKIDIIGYEDEARYAMFSMVIPELQMSSALMDIGGGNIKGGFLQTRKQFEAVNFPYGVKAFGKIVTKKNPDANIEEYTKNVDEEVKRVGEEISTELSRKVGIKNRKHVFLIGGIVYVMNAFLHPERAAIIGRPVEVNLEDVKKFRLMATTNYEELINPDLAKIADPSVRQIAESDVKTITTKIYNQQDIVAGAALLETVVKEFARDGVQKKFYFIKGADVSWISGYVFKMISDEYSAKKESGQ